MCPDWGGVLILGGESTYLYEVGTWSSVLIREVSFNRVFTVYEVGTWSSVLIREVSLIQGCPLRGFPWFTALLDFTV